MKPGEVSTVKKTASSRYEVSIIGGDAVFLCDRLLGCKVYLSADMRLTKSQLSEFVVALNHDLASLTTDEFFAKYGLKG